MYVKKNVLPQEDVTSPFKETLLLNDQVLLSPHY